MGNNNQLLVPQNKVLPMYADYYGNVQDFLCEQLCTVHNMLKGNQIYYSKLAKYLQKYQLYRKFQTILTVSEKTKEQSPRILVMENKNRNIN